MTNIQTFLENLRVNMKSISNLKMTRSVVNNKVTQYKNLDYLVDYHIEYCSVNNTHDFELQQSAYESVVDAFIEDMHTYTTKKIDIRLNASSEKNLKFYTKNDICKKTLTELFNSDIDSDMQLHFYRIFSHIMPLNVIWEASDGHPELWAPIVDIHLKNPFKSYDVDVFSNLFKLLNQLKNNGLVYSQMQQRILNIIDTYQNFIRDNTREQLDFFDTVKKHLPVEQWNKLVAYTPLLEHIQDNDNEKDIFSQDEKYLLVLRISGAGIKKNHPKITLMTEANKIMDSICDYLSNDKNNALNICELTYIKNGLYGDLSLKSPQPINKEYIITILNNVVSDLVDHVNSNYYTMNIHETIVETCINKAVLHHMLPNQSSPVKQKKI